MFIFLKGLIIGFALAIPIGPIGVMCIRKTITQGFVHGLLTGLAAATADLIYGSIAVFSLTFISDIVLSEILWFRLAGGGILLFLGIKIFRTKSIKSFSGINNRGFFKSYISIVMLTLTNPITIFAFIAVLAALNLGSGLGVYSSSALVAGIFSGSFLWFLLLSYFTMLFRSKISNTGFLLVNRFAGILIIISGIIAMASLL